MQLIITNKTFVPQLVWLSDSVSLSEELVLLKAGETKQMNRVCSSSDVTVWDRSSAYCLGFTDRKRIRSHFSVLMVEAEV